MKYILFLLFLLINNAVIAQHWLKVDSVFAVSGVTVKSFSAPAFADFNNDGKTDLLLGNITDITDFFWNNSNDFPSTFKKDTTVLWNVYSGGLQNTNSDYPAAVDLDGDGDYDLIISGYNGILYYENTGTPQNPVFQKVDTIFTVVNTLIGGDPKPAFADLDGDGDYDLLVGAGESLLPGPDPGTTLGFRNTGTTFYPIFELDNSLVAGIPDVGLNSYPAMADLDDDGDFDLLLGRDGGALYYYENTGSATQPIWTRNLTTFAGVETQSYWKNPSFTDLDYDGDIDLVYGQSTGILYVYRNNGTPSSPLFQFYPDYFKVIKLDGSGGTAFLADFDSDGDFDLLSGRWDGKFIYFRNDGNSQKPVFSQVNTSFSNLTVNSYSAPVFIDIDNDGDLDIVSGSLYGEIKLFINNNGTFTPDNSMFGFIDVGWMSVPAFADIDGDGDMDLLVGAETGTDYRYYENTEGNVFVENTQTFAGIIFPNYSRPTLEDIDNDLDYDLIIGRSNGSIIYYRNEGNTSTPLWTRADSVFEGVKVKQNAHSAFRDLDGDGRKDIVLAEYDGNFTFYKNLFAPSDVNNDESGITLNGFELFQNYPNPFNPVTNIRYHIKDQSRVIIEVFDMLGTKIQELSDEIISAGLHDIRFDGSNFSSGVYFYKISVLSLTDSEFSTGIRKMILLK